MDIKVKNKGFEDSLERLQDIVSKMEQGDISLDESLTLFEEGTSLVRSCNKMLDTAEKKVSLLIKKADGEVEEKDFSNE